MRNITLAFIISLLTASPGSVLAHSNSGLGQSDAVTISTNAPSRLDGAYLIAKNGADDGPEDVGDDHGAD